MDAMKRAQLWASDSYFDKDTRAQAAAVQQDGQALLAAFGSELRFG